MNDYKKISIIYGVLCALLLSMIYWGTIIFLVQTGQDEIVGYLVALVIQILVYIIMKGFIKRRTNGQLRLWGIILVIASVMFSSVNSLLIYNNFTQVNQIYLLHHLIICFFILISQLAFGDRNVGEAKNVSFEVAMISNAFFWYTVAFHIYVNITAEVLWIYYVNLPIQIVLYIFAYKKEQRNLKRFFLWDISLGILANLIYICYDTDNIFALFWGILEGVIILRILLISRTLILKTKINEGKKCKIWLTCYIVALCTLGIYDIVIFIGLLADYI